jgi:hypothetical protein
MSLSLYDISIPVFIRTLNTVSAFLEKGRAHAPASEAALLDERLIADMGNLSYQVQHLCDAARGCAVRVAQAAPVVFEDKETTFAELQETIAKTVAFLGKVDPKHMDGGEGREIVFAGRKFTGRSYVLGLAIPNFYFHVVTAYAILRKVGVPVGKRDYLGAN